MLDPYRMVVVNIVSSIVLICCLLVYKYIFPKRNISLLFLLILILILPTISIFRTGAYESGDFNIHIYRTMEFFTSLGQGNLMPSWAENLNATFGYPLFIFNYTLPYYVISLFHILGFSFIQSLKIFLASNMILSGLFMFLFAKKLLKNNFSAFATAIFYAFAPYHLIDIHFKVVIGEILFFTILPLTFLSVLNLQNKRNVQSMLIFALSFSALIMSHLIIALFAGALMLSYVLINSHKGNFRPFIYAIIGSSISLAISLYQWLGPVLLTKYSYIQNVKLGTAYFPTIPDLLYAPWRFGLLFQGPKGEISFLLGYVHLFVTILLFVLFLRKKVLKNIQTEILFWLTAFIVTVFLILPYSKPIWESFPIIKVVGSHRLLILTTFTSSILAGYLSLIFKKQWIIYALVIIAIGSTILNWGHRKVIPQINDNVLRQNLSRSTSEGEGHFYANTRWVDTKNPWFSIAPDNHLEVISGSAEIENILRTSTVHIYSVKAKSSVRIQENTLFYPGWKGFVDEKEILITPSDKGIILATIPEGNTTFKIIYQDFPLYKMLKIISISSFAALIIYLALNAVSIIKIRFKSKRLK